MSTTAQRADENVAHLDATSSLYWPKPISLSTMDAFEHQVLLDRLPARAIKVVMCIKRHINRKTGEANLKIETIAKETAMTERTVYRALDEVKERHVDIESGGGRRVCNRYFLLLQNPDSRDRVCCDVPGPLQDRYGNGNANPDSRYGNP